MEPIYTNTRCNTAHTTLQHIPKQLTQENRWMGTRFVYKPDGKIDKPPYRVRRGVEVIPASKTNPDNWATFKEASEALARGDVDAIGLVITANDPLTVLDFDDA